MKVLVQTNKRPQVHLEHEFKMIEHAGFIPVPYGYVESEPNVITVFGLTDLDDLKQAIVDINEMVDC